MYIHHVLKPKKVSIIYEEDIYGVSYRNYFIDKYNKKFKNNIFKEWSINTDKNQFTERLNEIILEFLL